MTLYNFHRSSASMRVRIALALKGLPYRYEPVDLFAGAGDQHAAPYLALNPQRLIPTLVDGAEVIGQSMAILEYLEETHPTPPLLPADPGGRARVRSIAQYIVSEMQPVNTLRIGKYLTETIGVDATALRAWRTHWLETGFDALEPMVGATAGDWCVGDTVTLADCCLYPQMWYAIANLGLSPGRWPTIAAIYARCEADAAFQAARPDAQPDAR